MPITFGGLSSGLPPNIVDQLIDAERIPLRTTEEKKGKLENKLKLVEDLDSKISAIQSNIGALASARGFVDIKLESGDPNIVSGVVDPSGFTRGSWNVEVVQLAEKAAAITNGFPDKDKTQIGVGYLSFETTEGTKEVYISGSNNTLEGVASAVNRAGVGIQATVISDQSDPENPYRLMLSGKQVGGKNTIDYPTLYFLDGDQDIFFEKEREAKNGIVKIDGFEINVGDNTIEDLIPGVTLELKQQAPGRSVNVNVKEDMEIVTGKVKTFTDSVNAVLSFIQQQNALHKDSDTTSTLGGDGVLRTIESRIRQLIQSPVYGTGSDLTMVNQLGISFNRGGLLEFSEDKFNSTLKQNPDSVKNFLSGDGFNTGFIPKLKSTIHALQDGTFGPLSNRRRGLKNQVEQMENRLEGMERRIAQKEQSLRRKFSALEEKMAGIQAQGSFLSGGGGLGGPQG